MAAATNNSLSDEKPVVVVGGGPAGLLCGVLLARAGVRVTVLEKHADFLRDFRGDTVHPSTLELFHQLGWLDELLTLPHSRIDDVFVRVAGRKYNAVNFRHLRLAAPFIAMMPQWDLLDFLARKGKAYPGFTLRMSSPVRDIVVDAYGRVDGIELASGEIVPARLVIAADGRRSVLRAASDLPLEALGAPMDVMWFRLDKPVALTGSSFGAFDAGKMLVFIERREYLQCAYILPKGRAESLQAQGIATFRMTLRNLVPELANVVNDLTDWSQVSLLDVALDRLTCWHRPGLLVIGDAAHAMSPIGGVGINVAVQDAVAAANVLAGPLAAGADPDPLLEKVQDRRWRAVTRMQKLQKLAQDRFVEPLLERTEPFAHAPWPLCLLDRFALLRRIPGRIIGLGFNPERIESPEA